MTSKNDDISILAFEKNQPQEVSDKRKITLIIALFIIIIFSLLLVKKFGPGFFSFILFISLLIIPIFFVFDKEITKKIFPIYEDNEKKLKGIEDKIGDVMHGSKNFISPKYQDYIVVFLMIVFTIAGLILVSKLNNLLGIVFAAVLFSTTGVLNSYFLSDNSPYIFERKHNQSPADDHVHRMGPLVTQGSEPHINV